MLDFVVCMVVGQCTGWFQATSPSWMRLSMMLMPYSVLMRLSRYQTMYSSSIAVNSSIVTPRKLLLWKNSCVLLQCLFDRFGSVFPQCGLMVFPGVVIVSR